MRRIITSAGSALALFLLAGCAAMAPQPVGLDDGRLKPCPDAPHCVSSDETREGYAIAPLKAKGAAGAAWATLVADVAAMPGVRAEASTRGYLHLTVRTPTMGYVDDVEFVLRADRGEIAMRSCSRLGYYDFGVNRDRLEALRERLRAAGVVE
jgi:uncharacterized protein (DUF1499 family)